MAYREHRAGATGRRSTSSDEAVSTPNEFYFSKPAKTGESGSHRFAEAVNRGEAPDALFFSVPRIPFIPCESPTPIRRTRPRRAGEGGSKRLGKDASKRSKDIPYARRREGYAGWRHAQVIDLPLNIFVTNNPSNDHLPDAQRVKDLHALNNPYRSMADRFGFAFAIIMTIESRPSDDAGYHAHYLWHVRPDKVADALRLIPGWGENIVAKRAHQREWLTRTGKVMSAFAYLFKAADWVTRQNEQRVYFQPSGYVTGGPRVFISRNLRSKAIAEAEVHRRASLRIRCERADISAHQLTRAPHGLSDFPGAPQTAADAQGVPMTAKGAPERR